ncbi:hypothetical protein KSX_09190 [Ktedonospora formicarum]|uniref:Sortilin N-terminal domain-containing protein n=1 Tax=Ktedonospora formicarum TaxID=2778364 RepID=A0A8J3HT30_9CHLR|nr:hypothetical protein KSX_09190 [Ktedonospora formicarum]
MRALAAQPDDPNQLYAGDQQGQIWNSSDGGSHWQARGAKLASGSAIQSLAFDVAGKNLYAATAQGLFSSSDYGRNWQNLTGQATSLPQTSYTALAFDDVRSQHIFVGTATQGVYVSGDNGKTWKRVGSDLPPSIQIKQLAYDLTSRQLWAATSAGVYRSDNQGESWINLTSSLPGDLQTNVVMPAPVGGGKPGLIYLGTNKGTFQSVDNGAHWEQGRSPIPGLQISSILVDFRQQQTSVPIYIGTNIGPLRSDDEGQTWRSIASGWPKGLPAYTMALGGKEYATLFVASRDAVYQYPGTNGGFGVDRLLPILSAVVLFGLLYWFLQRKQKRRGAPDKER